MTRYEDCFTGIEMTPTGDAYTAKLRFRDPTTGQELTEEWNGTHIADMAVTENGDLCWTLNLNLFPDIDPTCLFGRDTTP